jgi:ribosomal protein L21
VIEMAGKQFRVAKGDSILVDQPETKPLEARVLLVVDGDKCVSDRAALDKATVKLSAHGTKKEDQGRVMKFKPKQGRTSKRTIGSRRTRTVVKVDSLSL